VQRQQISTVQNAAQAVGIITPEFLPAANGDLAPDGVTVETYIQGTPASDADRARLRELLERFHARTRHFQQRPGFASARQLLTESRGGDVDLDSMPTALVRACRVRWKRIANEPQSAIHGDLNRNNVLITPNNRLALIDWDESRVDASLLDMAATFNENPGFSAARWDAATHALAAWEAATSWVKEPEYARGLALAIMRRRRNL